jgi:hypothetical protein
MWTAVLRPTSASSRNFCMTKPHPFGWGFILLTTHPKAAIIIAFSIYSEFCLNRRLPMQSLDQTQRQKIRLIGLAAQMMLEVMFLEHF